MRRPIRERHRTASATVALVALIAIAAGVAAAQGDGVQRLTVRVEAEYPHDPLAYTQGLLWHDGRLYESTGQYGHSTLRRVDLETGSVEESRELPEGEFGEGLALVGERLIQLTWRAGVAHVWSREGFEPVGSFRYDGEGWGLCSDAEALYMTDGSATIERRDPETFDVIGSFEVRVGGRPLGNLNELECAEGWIYANVYQTDWIARIDKETGEVVALVDASALRSRLGVSSDAIDVLNGIAYLPDRASFLVTGKYWPKAFEVIFVE